MTMRSTSSNALTKEIHPWLSPRGRPDEDALEPAGPFRESYLVGVVQMEDPAECSTEVTCPVT